jgi:hypothetical protein
MPRLPFGAPSAQGQSAYFAYFPSARPTATSTGKTNCWTGAGISNIPNSVRYRRVRKATSKRFGRRPPFSLCDAKSAARKYSAFPAGLMYPCAEKVALPRVPEAVPLARPEDHGLALSGKRRLLAGALKAELALNDGERLLLVVVDVHGRPGPRRNEVLSLEPVPARLLDAAGEGEPLASSVLDGVGVVSMFVGHQNLHHGLAR